MSLIVSGILAFALPACPVLAQEKAASEPTTHKSSGRDMLSCDVARKRATQINYWQLLEAMAICAKDYRPVDARYFYLLSQIRFAIDTELLYPRDGKAVKKLQSMSIFYAYRGGGHGPDDLFRDVGKAEKLFADLLSWRAQMKSGYSPGWDYNRLPPPDTLQETSERNVFNRVARLRWKTALLRNVEYRQAKIRREALYCGSDGSSLKPTEECRRLSARMEAIRQQHFASKPDYRQPKRIYVDPDADYRPLHIGINGPKRGGIVVLGQSAHLAQKSWLADALDVDQKAEILSKTDFETEALVVIAIGELGGFSGTLTVNHLAIGLDERVSYQIFVSVPENGCDYQPQKSYPFIVLAKKKPSEGAFINMRGRSRKNYGDGCEQPLSASPNNWHDK
ncbi:MAG: hypothetical protein ACI9JL_002258 [Paracoccaceae bacterium]|jgi:hypothetical protein